MFEHLRIARSYTDPDTLIAEVEVETLVPIAGTDGWGRVICHLFAASPRSIQCAVRLSWRVSAWRHGINRIDQVHGLTLQHREGDARHRVQKLAEIYAVSSSPAGVPRTARPILSDQFLPVDALPKYTHHRLCDLAQQMRLLEAGKACYDSHHHHQRVSPASPSMFSASSFWCVWSSLRFSLCMVTS